MINEPSQTNNQPFQLEQEMSSLSWRWGLSAAEDSNRGDLSPSEYPLPNLKLTFEEMEKLVDSWRPYITSHFPFAALPEIEKTQNIIKEMPVLAAAISCAALYGNLPRQIEVGQMLIREIAERMLFGSEKNVDLLLGILVLVAW